MSSSVIGSSSSTGSWKHENKNRQDQIRERGRSILARAPIADRSPVNHRPGANFSAIIAASELGQAALVVLLLVSATAVS